MTQPGLGDILEAILVEDDARSGQIVVFRADGVDLQTLLLNVQAQAMESFQATVDNITISVRILYEYQASTITYSKVNLQEQIKTCILAKQTIEQGVHSASELRSCSCSAEERGGKMKKSATIVLKMTDSSYDDAKSYLPQYKCPFR